LVLIPSVAHRAAHRAARGLAQVHAVAWSLVGKDSFLSASWDGTVKLWQPGAAGSLATWADHRSAVYRSGLQPPPPPRAPLRGAAPRDARARPRRQRWVVSLPLLDLCERGRRPDGAGVGRARARAPRGDLARRAQARGPLARLEQVPRAPAAARAGAGAGGGCAWRARAGGIWSQGGARAGTTGTSSPRARRTGVPRASRVAALLPWAGVAAAAAGDASAGRTIRLWDIRRAGGEVRCLHAHRWRLPPRRPPKRVRSTAAPTAAAPRAETRAGRRVRACAWMAQVRCAAGQVLARGAPPSPLLLLRPFRWRVGSLSRQRPPGRLSASPALRAPHGVRDWDRLLLVSAAHGRELLVGPQRSPVASRRAPSSPNGEDQVGRRGAPALPRLVRYKSVHEANRMINGN
jgi:hypothetical protein